MPRTLRLRSLAPLPVAVLTGELAVRLLAPRAPRPPVAQVPLREVFSEEEIARGRSFARPQMALGMAGMVLEAAAVAALALRPPPPLTRLEHRLDRLKPAPAGGAVLAAGLSLALTTVALPVRAAGRRRALKVGLATQSWPGWAGDLVKASVLGAGFAAGAGSGVLAAMARWPRQWWLVAGAGSVTFGAALAALAPVVLDPLFNDFTPLPQGEVRDDVLSLAASAGVRVREVYEVDASRRTTAANAYVTGLGPTKRVVLFDTLLDRYDRREVAVVVAHELAHVRARDVARGVLFAALVAPPAALASARLAEMLGAARPVPSSLPALALAAGAVAAPAGLSGNRLSRMLERRADAVSLELTQDPEAFIGFERKIALQNIADLEPPRWLTALLSTHPPTAERIGQAHAYAEAAATTPATAPVAR